MLRIGEGDDSSLDSRGIENGGGALCLRMDWKGSFMSDSVTGILPDVEIDVWRLWLWAMCWAGTWGLGRSIFSSSKGCSILV
ncbi:hypothetical protein Mapa_011983 [Marchantia paleacea]|nr:hypothetical protein Mapa_011983 [Marchantia paleacea]